MGLFDTFVLKVPIQCTNCYTGAFDEFQSKLFDCGMQSFKEGKVAGYHALIENKDRRDERVWQQINLQADQLYTPFWEACGSITHSDKIIRMLPDGVFSVYSWCDRCKNLFEVQLEIKNGIFIGVHNAL